MRVVEVFIVELMKEKSSLRVGVEVVDEDLVLGSWGPRARGLQRVSN